MKKCDEALPRCDEAPRHVMRTPADAARAGRPIAKGADMAVGGGRYRGVTTHSGVNVDPALQPEEKLRALNSQPYINWVGLVLHHDDLTDD
jgi:hypothetical protein